MRLERPVELDRVDACDAVGQIEREDAETGADLEHDVVGLQLGEPLDDPEDVLVDEEMLAEAAVRRERGRKPRGHAAYRLGKRLYHAQLLDAPSLLFRSEEHTSE